MRKTILLIFLSISHLNAMEVAEKQVNIEETIINFLIAYKKLSHSAINVYHSLPLPDTSMSHASYSDLSFKIFKATNQSTLHEAYKAEIRLPESILKKIRIYYNLQKTHPPSGILNPMEIAETKKLYEATVLLRTSSIFHYLQKCYPSIVLGTFEEFWNNVDDQERPTKTQNPLDALENFWKNL